MAKRVIYESTIIEEVFENVCSKEGHRYQEVMAYDWMGNNKLKMIYCPKCGHILKEE
jgi:hypothetical protein